MDDPSGEYDDDDPEAPAAKLDSVAELSICADVDALMAEMAPDSDDEEESLTFAERMERVFLEVQNGRGRTVELKATVTTQMAGVMGLTVKEFNRIFRDGETETGESLLTVYSHLETGFRNTCEHRCPRPEKRQHWKSIDWNAWVLDRLVRILWKDPSGPLNEMDMSEEVAYQVVWALRKNRLYHDPDKKATSRAPRTPKEKLLTTVERQERASRKSTNVLLTSATPLAAVVSRVVGRSGEQRRTVGAAASRSALANVRADVDLAAAVTCLDFNDGTQQDAGDEDDESDLEEIGDDLLGIRDMAVLKEGCPDKSNDACKCTYHAVERAKRICIGTAPVLASVQVDDDDDADAAAVVSETPDGSATVDSAEGPMLPLMRSVEEAQAAVERQRRLDQLMSSGVVTNAELEEAVGIMGCDAKLRMRGSRMRLHWWQVRSAARVVMRARSADDRGVILAEQVGLGKTMIALAAILRVGTDDIEAWQAARVKAGNDKAALEATVALRPKPFLILVPATLIMQWKEETAKFSQNRLRVYVYHGDQRTRVLAGVADRIRKPLRRDSAVLQWGAHPRKEASALPHITVIVTSHETFRGRHGPQVLKTFRVTDTSASGLNLTVPPRDDEMWVHDLRDSFSMVVVDEAHMIRGQLSYAHQSVNWFKPGCFRLLMTATPFWSHPADLTGLLRLVEPQGRSAQAQAQLGSANPWMLPDTDPQRELRFSAHAYEQFYVSSGRLAESMMEADDGPLPQTLAEEGDDPAAEDDAAYGGGAEALVDSIASDDFVAARAPRIGEVCWRFVLRQDYMTTLEGPNGGQRVSKTLPIRLAYALQCPLPDAAQAMYDHVASEYTNHLFARDERTGRVRVNGYKLRALYMVALNPTWQFAPILMNPRDETIQVSRLPHGWL